MPRVMQTLTQSMAEKAVPDSAPVEPEEVPAEESPSPDEVNDRINVQVSSVTIDPRALIRTCRADKKRVRALAKHFDKRTFGGKIVFSDSGRMVAEYLRMKGLEMLWCEVYAMALTWRQRYLLLRALLYVTVRLRRHHYDVVTATEDSEPLIVPEFVGDILNLLVPEPEPIQGEAHFKVIHMSVMAQRQALSVMGAAGRKDTRKLGEFNVFMEALVLTTMMSWREHVGLVTEDEMEEHRNTMGKLLGQLPVLALATMDENESRLAVTPAMGAMGVTTTASFELAYNAILRFVRVMTDEENMDAAYRAEQAAVLSEE